jgi:T-complex protein 1 subunit delta
MSRALIVGGGAPEIHLSRKLTQYAQTLKGKESYCYQAFAEALEVIPTTLAENAGLNPIAIVTELRNRHANGEHQAGINVKKVSLALLGSGDEMSLRAGHHLEHFGRTRRSASACVD